LLFIYEISFVKSRTMITTFKKLMAILITAAIIAGCTMTTTKTKAPVFSITTEQLQKDLNKLVSCENVNLDGKETNTNGQISSELEVDIINGKGIPADDDQMISLGRSIASDLKKSLKDPNQYSSYKVLFVKKQTDGSMTQRSWRGKVFKSEEL
jgi:hypothetical protein